MPRIEFDPKTAERLIDGRTGALPPETAPVAHVLDAARRAATEREDDGGARMAATLAAMRSAIVPEGAGTGAARLPRRRDPLAPLPRLIAAGTAAVTVLFGGLAAAGALPSAAQKPVADIVSHVGIELPRPANNDKPADKPAETPATPSTTSTTEELPMPAAEAPPTTSPTETTTVTAPACPPPSREGPNGCVTPLPVPPTTVPPPTTTTTVPPPPPTTTVPPTTTTVPSGNGGGHSHGISTP